MLALSVEDALNTASACEAARVFHAEKILLNNKVVLEGEDLRNALFKSKI
jgi:hypothetical protein